MFQNKNSDMLAMAIVKILVRRASGVEIHIRAWLLAKRCIKVRHINAVEQSYCRILDSLSIALYWGRVMRVADDPRCYQNV